MKTRPACAPCLVQQAVTLGTKLGADDTLFRKLVTCAFANLAQADFSLSPPEIAESLYQDLCRVIGDDDPYAGEKRICNESLMGQRDEFLALITESDNPFATALELAIAGNAIDFGVQQDVAPLEALTQLRGAIGTGVDHAQLADLVASAENILYLADNAGELVLDRLFIEQMPAGRVTVAVRGRPIINDCTLPDADYVGISQVVPVISNGSGIPGTVPSRCTSEFQAVFESADLIISKGQGNYETLCGTMRPIVFLMKVKCAVVAEQTGLDMGTLAVIPKNIPAGKTGATV